MSEELRRWLLERDKRERAYVRATADYIGAGGNTYEEANRKKQAALRALQKADAKVRELEKLERGKS